MKRFLIWILLLSPNAFAHQQGHYLFSDEGKPNYVFDQSSQILSILEVSGVIKSLRPIEIGEKIILPSGISFEYLGVLNAGNNTVIVKTSGNRVVRLMQKPGLAAQRYLTDYYHVYSTLLKVIPAKNIVRIFKRDSDRQANGVFVEELFIDETLDVYLSRRVLRKNSEKFLELLEFVKGLQGIEMLNDFWPFQVGWVRGRGWVLFDWGDRVRVNFKTREDTSENWLEAWKHMSVRKANVELLQRELRRTRIEFKATYQCRGFLW